MTNFLRLQNGELINLDRVNAVGIVADYNDDAEQGGTAVGKALGSYSLKVMTSDWQVVKTFHTKEEAQEYMDLTFKPIN